MAVKEHDQLFQGYLKHDHHVENKVQIIHFHNLKLIPIPF